MWQPWRVSWLLLASCASLLPAIPSAPLKSPTPAPATVVSLLPNGTIERPRKDLDSSATATGYIYRKDGNKPALFLKLGAGQNAGDGFSFEPQQQQLQQHHHHQQLQQPQQQRLQRPYSSAVRLGKIDGIEGHLETGGHNFSPEFGGHLASAGTGPSHIGGHDHIGGHQTSGVDDVPHFGPEHLDTPGQHDVPDHFETGAGLDEHLSDGRPGYLTPGSGPLHGLGDVAEEYLAPLKSARTKHATKLPAGDEYGEDYKAADDYTALKTIGDEFSSPLKLAIGSEEYVGGTGGHAAAGHLVEKSAPLKSHADYHHGGYGGGGGGGGHGKSYSKGGGSKNAADHFSTHGVKSGKSHKSTNTHGGGSVGAHGSEAHKGHFASAGGAKKVHHDEAGKYGSQHTDTKGSAGGKHGEKGHGKKGHKSTGFHNVYNKDEFKKDTSFYDSHDKGGQHHKGGDYASQHGGKSGAHKKGGHHGSAYDEGHKGKNSHVDKGKVSDDHKANKGSSQHEAQYANKEEYGKKDGAASGKKYSHKGGGGAGGGGYGHHR